MKDRSYDRGGATMRKRLFAIVLTVILLGNVNAYAMSTEEATIQLKVMMDFIMENYVGSEVTEEDLYDAALEGMFQELDKYSEMYNTDEYDEFMEDVSGSYVGIGAYIQQMDNYIIIVEPMKGSPAEKSGLKAGDIIVAVDGKDLKDYPYDVGIQMLKGELDSKSVLTVKSGQSTKEVTVTRKEIHVNAVKSIPLNELRPNEKKEAKDAIWYVDIDSFNATVANDFKEVIEEAKKDKIKGLIIDLRNNTGGYLDQVIEMCDMVIPEGVIISAKDKQGNMEVYSSTLKKAPFQLVVLTNEYTASASEVFTSAVQDSKTGIIVGENTYGKGIVNVIYNFGPDTKIKMSVKEYFSRNGNKINGIGIKPDILVAVPDFIMDVDETMEVGYKSETVKQLEDILVYLGYIKEADDLYDSQTEEAIKKFQLINKITRDGIADENTIIKLNEALFIDQTKRDIQLDKAIETILELISDK